MAQEDGIKKAAAEVAKSKKLLERGEDFTKKVEGKSPSAYVPKAPVKPATPAASKPAAKSAGLLGEAEDVASGLKAKTDMAAGALDAPKMHDGGKVKEDGPKTLQKGEVVLPKDEKKAMKVLKEKAGGVMSAAMKEEEEEKDEKESPAEEKKEGKKGEKAEEKKEPKKEEKKEPKKGKKAKGLHLRHGSSGGFIAKHDAMMGEDGAMGEQEEHVLPNKAAMLAHVEEHMGDGEDVGAPAGSPVA
jgi:hypothetical protein